MKALALFSGGLDSMLSMKIISDQNIEVVALYMDTGFGVDEEKHEVLRRRAALAGASLKVVDMRNEYLRDVLFNPKYGYGKQFNPCIDCHGYMFKTALNMLKSENANFIITGEVVGQMGKPEAVRIITEKRATTAATVDFVQPDFSWLHHRRKIGRAHV